MRNVSDKSYREFKTHILYLITLPSPRKNRAVYDIDQCGKNIAEPDMPQMTV